MNFIFLISCKLIPKTFLHKFQQKKLFNYLQYCTFIGVTEAINNHKQKIYSPPYYTSN